MCLVLALAGVAAACSSRSDVQANPASTASANGTPSPTADPTPDPTDTAAPVIPDSSALGTAPEPPVVIRWIRQFAPQGGGGSDRELTYSLLMRNECASAHDVAADPGDGSLPGPLRNLYAAAASACLAAFEGRTDAWEDATSRLDAVQGSEFSCWEQELHAITTELVNTHVADPQVTFERSGEGGASSCPYVTSLDPSHGSTAGGYDVRVIGENLPPILQLHFGNTRVEAVLHADGTASLTVPPAAQPGIVVIHVVDAPGRGVGADVSFTYDDQSPTTQDESILEAPAIEPTPIVPTP